MKFEFIKLIVYSKGEIVKMYSYNMVIEGFDNLLVERIFLVFFVFLLVMLEK